MSVADLESIIWSIAAAIFTLAVGIPFAWALIGFFDRPEK